ncbi:hypothetical protein H4219_002540 [Mycoemilia scoparia]|uniref:Uncharacterized protein n=1 Tax=Mycoemilia scoparia TaxID=417184 RepID=A0A9W8A6M4_9FUNG|nr:hypothetical protein H4219_002540 [Mycoemilia scoparia]
MNPSESPNYTQELLLHIVANSDEESDDGYVSDTDNFQYQPIREPVVDIEDPEQDPTPSNEQDESVVVDATENNLSDARLIYSVLNELRRLLYNAAFHDHGFNGVGDHEGHGTGRVTFINISIEHGLNNSEIIQNLLARLSTLDSSLEFNVVEQTGSEYNGENNKLASSTYFGSTFKRQIPHEPTKFSDFGEFADNLCYIFKVLGIFNSQKPSESMNQYFDEKLANIDIIQPDNGDWIDAVPETTLAEIRELTRCVFIEPPYYNIDGEQKSVPQDFINHLPLVRYHALDIYYKDRVSCKYELPIGMMFNVVTSQEDGRVFADIDENGEPDKCDAGLDPTFEIRSKIAQKLIADGKEEMRCSLCFDEILESQQYMHFGQQICCKEYLHLSCIYSGCVDLYYCINNGPSQKPYNHLDKLVDILVAIEREINRSRYLNIYLELNKLANIELDIFSY